MAGSHKNGPFWEKRSKVRGWDGRLLSKFLNFIFYNSHGLGSVGLMAPVVSGSDPLPAKDWTEVIEPSEVIHSHGIAERQRVGVLLVSCVIDCAGNFLHGTPRALSISRKNGVVPAGNDAISPWEAMTKSRCGFADPLIRVLSTHLGVRIFQLSWTVARWSCDGHLNLCSLKPKRDSSEPLLSQNFVETEGL